jgi:hypothetical protein
MQSLTRKEQIELIKLHYPLNEIEILHNKLGLQRSTIKTLACKLKIQVRQEYKKRDKYNKLKIADQAYIIEMYYYGNKSIQELALYFACSVSGISKIASKYLKVMSEDKFVAVLESKV